VEIWEIKMAKKETKPSTDGTLGQLIKYLIAEDIHPTNSDNRPRWTQEVLAERLGLESRVQVGRWATDKLIPPRDRADLMEALFFGNDAGIHENLRTTFRKKLREASEMQRKFGNPILFAQSTVLLFWNYIRSEANLNINFDEFTIKSKTLEEAHWILENKLLKWEYQKIDIFVRHAREYVFDVKYGNQQIDEDERHAIGIDGWTNEISNILNSLGVSYNKKLVNVGLGAGLEGREIYNKFLNFVGVDLSRSALEAASSVFSNLQAIHGEAEKLPTAAHDCDVYISLKTFSSSFFDIDAAVKSCAKCLRSNGVAIISVPRGYYKDGKLIPGISATNYELSSVIDGNYYTSPDRSMPFNISFNIIRSLYKWLFYVIQVITGRHEFYITARKI
jgi:SAM-dependent methyltransferase